jgi:hypothetical protein
VNQLLGISRAIKGAKLRTGRNIACPINQGHASIVDWTGIPQNGKNNPAHIAGPFPIDQLIQELDKI